MRYHVWYWICHIGTSNIAFVASIACNFTFFASIAWTCACDKNTNRHDCPTVWKQSWNLSVGTEIKAEVFLHDMNGFFFQLFFHTKKMRSGTHLWQADMMFLFLPLASPLPLPWFDCCICILLVPVASPSPYCCPSPPPLNAAATTVAVFKCRCRPLANS